MEELTFNAIRQLQFIHDFPCVPRFLDCSDSPSIAIWDELESGAYIVPVQGFSGGVPSGMGYDITPKGNAFLLEFTHKLESKDIESIFLNKAEYKLLKNISKSKDIVVESEKVRTLVLAGVANFRFKEDLKHDGGCVEVCSITNTGKRYISYRKEQFIKTWIPIVISVLAFISSIAFPLILSK